MFNRVAFGLSTALVAILLLGIILHPIFAQDTSVRHSREHRPVRFDKPVWIDGIVTSTRASASVSVASGGTISVADRYLIEVTATTDTTGVMLTGGKINQVVRLVTGSGSNTIRLDDGTSMTLGGSANKTLTEGQKDFIELTCNSADGDEWFQTAYSDN